MSELKICRVCLRADGKMYKYDEYQLKDCYEQVMSMKWNEMDNLPKCFCFECAALLHKFHKFKEKCYRGQKALKEILWNEELTYKSLEKIDRENKDLKSNIDVIIVSDRVKTRILKHKYKSTENVELDLPSEISYKNDDHGETAEKEIIENKEANVEEVLHDDLSTAVDDKLSSDDETQTKQEGDEILNITETTIGFDDRMSSDDENALIDLTKENVDKQSNENILLNNKQKIDKNKGIRRKKNKDETEEKTNKFKLESKKAEFLDSSNWLKIYLTEEEAERELKARGEDRKYLKMPYKCTDCFKGFSQQDMLDRHIKLRHVETLGPFECRFCRMRFKWNCYLMRHMPRHYTIYKCLRCNLVFRMEISARLHEDCHNGVKRKCKHCGEEFKHLSTYYTHLRTHRSAHVCRVCGVSFVSDTGLRLHQKAKHVGATAAPDTEPPEESDQANTYCEKCDVKFETEEAYQEHLIHSAMHADGFDDLDRELPALSNSKRRKILFKRKHRKATTCNNCGENFSNQTEFTKHHLAAHPGIPIPITSHRFARTRKLSNERRICEICGISLKPMSVASHLKRHTDGQNQLVKCSTCGLQVSCKSSLTRHQQTHNDERPFPCSMCEKKFKHKCSMQLHYRTFHLKQPYPRRNRRKKSDPDEIPLSEYLYK